MKRSATKRWDRRVRRTRQALFEALVDLIVEKGYERTTVREVLERADVGRATFYAHFYNKQDLLLGHMSLFQLDVGDRAGKDGKALRVPDVTHLFAHVAHFQKPLKAMRRSEGLQAALAIAREDLTASFQKLLAGRQSGAQSVSRDTQFLAQFLAGGLLHLLMWWLDQGMPQPPETMARWFRQLGEQVLHDGGCGSGTS